MPETCAGSIKLTIGPNVTAFTPLRITVAAGWLPNKVIVSGFSNGKFVGRTTWNLTTDPQTIPFPNTWNDLTQLIFVPDFVNTNAIYPPAGSLVIYKIELMTH